MFYKGRHYNRALLKEATRKLTEFYVEEERQQPWRKRPKTIQALTEQRTTIADYNLLTLYLGFLAAAKTDAERSDWWREAQEHARKLGFNDYKLHIYRHSQ